MRHVAVMLVALLVSVSAASAQSGSPAVPSQLDMASLIDTTAKPQTGSKAALDFEAWGKAMSDVANIRVELSLTREDPVFQKKREYDGVLLFSKPNLMIMRLNYTADDTKQDYEAYICNGKSVYRYIGLEKSVTELKLSTKTKHDNIAEHTDLPATTQTNSVIDPVEQRYEANARRLFFMWTVGFFPRGELLAGTNPINLRQRFEIHLIKEDENYIYLNMKPIRKEDKMEFQQINMALYGPKTKFAYLPARIIILMPNGDTEQWNITNPQINIPGIDGSKFQYVPVAGLSVRRSPILEPEPAPAIPEKSEPTPLTPDNKTPEPPVLQSSYSPFVECPCVPRVRLRDRLRWRMMKD
jgi:TIGR03009 family protein